MTFQKAIYKFEFRDTEPSCQICSHILTKALKERCEKETGTNQYYMYTYNTQ